LPNLFGIDPSLEKFQILQMRKLGSMLSIKKQNWTTNQIKTEINDLEAELLKAARELMDLENRYRSEKMEMLAKIETYEARLNLFKSML
jgi:hypothetical protein